MYFMTSLRGKNEVQVQVQLEKYMHNYNATLVDWVKWVGLGEMGGLG